MTRRVAIITHRFPTVSETFVADHVVGLKKRGWDPVVVCQDVDGRRLVAMARRAGEIPVVVEPAPRSPLLRYARHLHQLARTVSLAPRAALDVHGRGMLARVPALRTILNELRPDLVHAHFGTSGIPAALAVEGRIPLVIEFHGWDFNVLPRRIGWEVLRKTLGGCVLVAHSAFAQERLERHLGRQVVRFPLGVDLSAFSAPERDRSWPVPVRLLTVGRLIPQKGIDVAIRALAELRRTEGCPNAALTIVGDGPEREALGALASGLSLEDRVRFVPSVPHHEVAFLMASSDVLLVPSVVTPDGAEEAFGRVAVEGLAAGMAVVVTATGGLPETVGDAGWTVVPGDPRALAARILRIAREESPADVCARARSRAEEFSIEKSWDSYANVAADAMRR